MLLKKLRQKDCCLNSSATVGSDHRLPFRRIILNGFTIIDTIQKTLIAKMIFKNRNFIFLLYPRINHVMRYRL